MAHWGMEDVQACFGDTADLNTRQITVGGQRLGLLFLDGLTSGGDIAEQVLKPLMETVTPGSIQEVLTQAERARVYCAVAERTQDPAQTADKLLHGYCAVIFPVTDTALCFETKTSARRGPSAPESENTVGKHCQGREGRVYRDDAHQHQPPAPPSAHGAAALFAEDRRPAHENRRHGLLSRRPDRAGACPAHGKAAGEYRH